MTNQLSLQAISAKTQESLVIPIDELQKNYDALTQSNRILFLNLTLDDSFLGKRHLQAANWLLRNSLTFFPFPIRISGKLQPDSISLINRLSQLIGTIAVENELSRRKINELLPSINVLKVGLPHMQLSHPYGTKERSTVFGLICPSNKAWELKAVRTHLRDEHFISFPLARQSLQEIGAPCLSTIQCPEHALELISSCQEIITLDPNMLGLALSAEVPTVFVRTNQGQDLIAEDWNIPQTCLRNLQTTLESLRHTAKAKSVREAQRRTLHSLCESQNQYLQEHLSLATRPRKNQYSVAMKPSVTVATLSDWQNIPSLLGLKKNLAEWLSPDTVQLYVLALDKKTEKFLSNDSSLRVHSYSINLPSDQKRRRSQIYQQKPPFLKKVLSRVEGPVLYCDIDIYHQHPIVELAKDPRLGTITLFPHLFSDSQLEQHYGKFNAGMILLKPGAERFLDWWIERVNESCCENFSKAMYYDQKYLDEAAKLFPEITIYPEPNHNIGPWSQPVAKSSIRSLHVSDRDPKGHYVSKFALDQIESLKHLPRLDYLKLTDRIALEQQRRMIVSLERILNAHHLFAKRIKISFKLPHSKWINFFAVGPGSPIISLLSTAYSVLRTIKRKVTGLTTASYSLVLKGSQ